MITVVYVQTMTDRMSVSIGVRGFDADARFVRRVVLLGIVGDYGAMSIS